MLFCDFCIMNYGGSYEYEKTEFGTIMKIKAGRDVFKINLSDKWRFGEYTLRHRDFGERLGGGYCYHKQITCKDLRFALYCAWTHDFNKSLGLKFNKEDYHRFCEDYSRFRSRSNKAIG